MVLITLNPATSMTVIVVICILAGLGVSIAFGPLPAILLCLGILFAILYPLGRDEYARVGREPAERRTSAAEEAA